MCRSLLKARNWPGETTLCKVQTTFSNVERVFQSMKKEKTIPTESDIKAIAEKTLLPPVEVQMWLEHLQQVDLNRRLGAAKAAETRCRRTANTIASSAHPNPTLEANVNPEPIPGPAAETEDVYYCGYCGGQYEEETEECEFWIGCEACDCWFHGVCWHCSRQ